MLEFGLGLFLGILVGAGGLGGFLWWNKNRQNKNEG
jgi:UDP-N-acetylmuramyl pentapeptide phosphotransferase/UDP-N-acetylglucosamine-1-phosphate transferase